MKSNRRDFLRLTGLVSAATLIPYKNIIAAESSPKKVDECVLIPTETAGPFPLDLSDNSFFFRQGLPYPFPGVCKLYVCHYLPADI